METWVSKKKPTIDQKIEVLYKRKGKVQKTFEDTLEIIKKLNESQVAKEEIEPYTLVVKELREGLKKINKELSVQFAIKIRNERKKLLKPFEGSP